MNKPASRSGFGIYLLLLAVRLYSSTDDTLKTSYAITDPRNPGCVCHTYQKQADDEFKTLLAQVSVKRAGLNTDNSRPVKKHSVFFKKFQKRNNGRAKKHIRRKKISWKLSRTNACTEW